MGIRTAGHFFAYIVVRALICLVQATRIETCQTVASGLAWLCTSVIPIRRALVDENFRLAFPSLTPLERRCLARQMWEHLFVMVIEVAHAPRKLHHTNWRDYVRLAGHDELLKALLDDRPVIIVSGHFGNFELGGYFLGIL